MKFLLIHYIGGAGCSPTVRFFETCADVEQHESYVMFPDDCLIVEVESIIHLGISLERWMKERSP